MFEPFLIVLLVAVFVGGLLIGIGGSVCECEDEEWDDEATFTTSYPEDR